jgi:thiol-disulfide isomerase/thioredoxin/tetratricopeptide (TPR) repeat protein
MSNLRLGIVILAGMVCACTAEAADPDCHYPAEARALVTDWTGDLAAGYRAKLPDDAATLFLVGVSLLSKDPAEAVRDFDRAVAKDPHYPWPYFELMDIYASLQPSPSKLAANMRAYRSLCPANADAFRYLSRITDRTETQAFAEQLRTLLEHASAPPDLTRYADLWAAEFRSAPPTEFDALRDRVRGDLKRLEPLAQGDRALLYTVAKGYELTGQTEAAHRAVLEAQRRSDPAEAAYLAWQEQHPYSARPRSPEELRTYREAHRKAAEEWAAKWPDSRMSWSEMLLTASTPEQASQAGEKVIQLAAEDPEPQRRASSYGNVARVWLKYGVRSKDVPALAEQALRELDRTESAAGPLVVESNSEVQSALNRANQRFGFWNTLLDAGLHLGDIDRAARIPKDMQVWLAAHPIKPETPPNVVGFYPRWEGFVNVAQGKVAEAQGRKADAIAYYQRVLIGPAKQYPGNMILARAQALWKEMGGTDEGWLAWSKPVESSSIESKPIARAAALPSVPAEGAPGWMKVDRSFADLNLSDLTGKIWTVADLQGKTTMIDVWASWCGPCTAELPHIQELYDKIKTRTDVQLVTLNVDENPGMADLLVKKQHYTFPVLMAEEYFTQIQPALSVPRTWIADKTGAAHLEKINSNDANGSPTFVQDVLDQLKRQ